MLGVNGWLSAPAAGFVEVHDRGFSANPALPFPGIALPPVVLLPGGAAAAVPVLMPGFLLGFGRRLVVSRLPPIQQGHAFLCAPPPTTSADGDGP